jgi:hypothetical protein
MTELLFADDLTRLVIIFIVLFVWGLGHVVRMLNQGGGPVQRPANPRRARPPAAEQQETADTIDRFLTDLGVKERPVQRRSAGSSPVVVQSRSRERSSTTRPGATRYTSPPRRETRQPQPASARKQAVGQRHLAGGIETRHQDELHSTLENQHLSAKVPSKSLGQAIESVVVSPVFDIRGLPPAAGDPVLNAMMRDNQQLTRAFVLGEVLGAPLALRQIR